MENVTKAPAVMNGAASHADRAIPRSFSLNLGGGGKKTLTGGGLEMKTFRVTTLLAQIKLETLSGCEKYAFFKNLGQHRRGERKRLAPETDPPPKQGRNEAGSEIEMPRAG